MSGNRLLTDKPKETPKKISFKNITPNFNTKLNADTITKRLPYLMFCFVLLIIYITNSHIAETTVRNINKTTKDLKELRWEYKSLKAELMYSTRESGIVQMMKQIGLQELTEPPIVLEASNIKPNK